MLVNVSVRGVRRNHPKLFKPVEITVLGRNDNMDTSDKEYLIKCIEEATRAGYRQGWEDGYEAARLTVEMMVEAWRENPAGIDFESALKAIELCREKAREMLARDKFTVRCIPSTEPGQKWFG